MRSLYDAVSRLQRTGGQVSAGVISAYTRKAVIHRGRIEINETTILLSTCPLAVTMRIVELGNVSPSPVPSMGDTKNNRRQRSTNMDNRLRYYFHGDAYEADTSLHYCIGCDGFEPLEHFSVCTLRAKFWPRRPRSYEAAQHHGYKESKRIWRRYGRSMRERYRVEADPLNPFLLPPEDLA